MPERLRPLASKEPGRSAVARAVPAVTRAIKILRLLGESQEPLGVNAIAHALHLIPSTCLHIVRALAEQGLVAFNPATKRYTLDAGILVLARTMLKQNGFDRAVQPMLDEVAVRFGVTAIYLRVIGLQYLIVAAISRSERALRLHVDVGSRFPALISASGRCLAAFGGYPARELKRGFGALRWDNAPSYRAWLAEVESARRNGFSVDDGNYIRGVTIVAAPVFADGTMKDVVAVVGIREQIEQFGATRVASELRDVANALSEHSAA